MPIAVTHHDAGIGERRGADIPFSCPYSVRLHPEVDGVEQHAAAWVRSSGLADTEQDAHRMDRYRTGWFAAACLPDKTRDMAELLADFSSWILHVDDLVDTPTGLAAGHRDLWPVIRLLTLAARCADAPEANLVESWPVLLSWRDICWRLSQVTTWPL